MEDHIVVVASLSKRGKVLARFRSMFIVELDGDGTLQRIVSKSI